jgi:3-hydroxyisobutyrate dehydrogenase-like beta-hydroxyacid dehydrogenase
MAFKEGRRRGPGGGRQHGQPLVQRPHPRGTGEIGNRFLGAPCTGSTPGAINGTLTFMVGGDEKVFERVRRFSKSWQEALLLRWPGMGLHAKLTQNLVLSNILQAFNEGIVLSTKAGVDPKLMLDILPTAPRNPA